MRKEIKIGDKSVALVTNLGTARLYEIFTKTDVFRELIALRAAAKDDPTTAALAINELYKKLGYVMAVQASKDSIEEMKAEMTEDKFLEWLFQFDVPDWNGEVLNEIASLWSSQTETNSSIKNA